MFDIAQICLNGHVINGDTIHYPEYSKDYCTDCGSETIKNCPSCKGEIRGNSIDGIYDTIEKPPAYCHLCGKPYPWTDTTLQSTQELIELEESISQEEKDYFSKNLPEILVETPKTKLVATKLKIFLNKASREVSSGVRDIIVDIASETAKKIIFS